MKKLFLVALVVMLGLSSLVYASVEIKSAGTVVDKTETVNFTGPSVAKSGSDVNVDLTSHTGTLTVSDDIYSEQELIVDGSLYLNGSNGMSQPLFLVQPDGGCSSCGVDAAGTTFACVDMPCPAGMVNR